MYIMGNDKPEGVFKFVITKIDFSRPGYAIWSEAKKEAIETEKNTGMETKKPSLNFKEHGMSLELFVLEQKIAENEYELVDKVPNNKFKLDILTPPMLYKPKSGRSSAIAENIKGGLAGYDSMKAKLNKQGKFIITDILPSGYEIKDFATGFTATDIPEDHPKYDDIRKKESIRRDGIANVLRAWDKMNEEEAYNMLKTIASRRLLLHHYKEDGAYFVNPEPGLVFVAKLEQPYYKLKIAEWNREKREFDLFTMPVNSLDEETFKEYKDFSYADVKAEDDNENDNTATEEEEDDAPW